MINYYTIPWKWKPLKIKHPAPALWLDMLFKSWEGTPYMGGNQCKGSGVDCVRFTTAILDLMEGNYHSITTLPSDVSFHNRRGAMRSMIKIKRLYSHRKVNPEKGLQPGDMIIVGPPGGGPGHAMLVGTEPNTIWHCTPNSGVVKTGWSLVNGQQKIFRIYRIKDREKRWT